ncbi:MAG: hypothetical protein M1822_006177 [Bathelium mastoideum]|nr:MAG: hypothetical protein M1822_006177 [Bathelium mastoideum]
MVHSLVYDTVKPSSIEENSDEERLRLQIVDREANLNRYLSSMTKGTSVVDVDSSIGAVDPDDVDSDLNGSNSSSDDDQALHEASRTPHVPDNELDPDDVDSNSSGSSSSSDDDQALPDNELEFLSSVMKFLTTTQPFIQFRADLRRFIYPPTTLSEALDAGDVKQVRRMLLNNFKLHTHGEFSWLKDLEDMGFDRAEITDILVEDLIDAPWIRYNLPRLPTLEIAAGKHLY